MARPGRGARTLTIGTLGLALGLGCATPAGANGGTPGAAVPAVLAHTAPAGATAASGQPARIQGAVNEAAAYARNRGYIVGIAVVDVGTGRAYTGGLAEAYFPAESTIKVMLATNLKARGRITGDTATAARAMLQVSDDTATNQLYYAAGGDGVVSWSARRYGIPALGTGPKVGPGWWGSCTVSPLGFARFLVAAKKDPDVGPWLVRTMAGAQPTAADGTAQLFGLDAADPTSAAKTGWGHSTPGGGYTGTPTVGWARQGRYAVAVFTGRYALTSYTAGMTLTTATTRIVVAGLA